MSLGLEWSRICEGMWENERVCMTIIPDRVGCGPSLVWIRELNQNGSSCRVKNPHLNENLSLRSRNASYVWRSMLRERCWGSQGAKEWASGNALHMKALHELVINAAVFSFTCQEPSSLQSLCCSPARFKREVVLMSSKKHVYLQCFFQIESTSCEGAKGNTGTVVCVTLQTRGHR